MLLFFQLVDSSHLLWMLPESSMEVCPPWMLRLLLLLMLLPFFHLHCPGSVCMRLLRFMSSLLTFSWHTPHTHTDPSPLYCLRCPCPLPATGPRHGSSASLFTHLHPTLGRLPKSSRLFIVSWCALLLLTRKARMSILSCKMILWRIH